MPAKIQSLAFAVGANKQSNISSIGSTFVHFDKLNATLVSPAPTFESDKAYIGKGGPQPEAATSASAVAWEVKSSIEAYASAEFSNWVLAYGLGNASVTSNVYTITPLDTRVGLELPYFTLVEQLEEGGVTSPLMIDNAYVGCALNDFTYAFNSGPGRQSSKMTCNWVGSGNITSPSSVSIPSLSSLSYMLAGGMTLTVNGTDYVGNKTIVSGEFKVNNNLLVKDGYFPGSGVQGSGAGAGQVMGRIEVGDRDWEFNFTVRYLSSGNAYTQMIDAATGSVSLHVQYDSTHYMTIEIPLVQFTNIQNTVVDGLVCQNITATPLYNGTNPICTVTCESGINTFAQ